MVRLFIMCCGTFSSNVYDCASLIVSFGPLVDTGKPI